MASANHSVPGPTRVFKTKQPRPSRVSEQDKYLGLFGLWLQTFRELLLGVAIEGDELAVVRKYCVRTDLPVVS